MARLYVVECLAIGQVKGVLTIFAFVGEGFELPDIISYICQLAIFELGQNELG